MGVWSALTDGAFALYTTIISGSLDEIDDQIHLQTTLLLLFSPWPVFLKQALGLGSHALLGSVATSTRCSRQVSLALVATLLHPSRPAVLERSMHQVLLYIECST
jgi:hypothetical protein